jgi:hypothetical protein
MTTLKYPIVALAAVLLLGLVGLTLVIMGGHGEVAGHHGESGGPPEAMARLIERLELTPEQHRHVERIHGLMEATHHGSGPGSMAHLHERLVAQCSDGEVRTSDLRPVVDEHVEQVRRVLYSITDEFVALVGGLDARQRRTLIEHLGADSRHGAS